MDDSSHVGITLHWHGPTRQCPNFALTCAHRGCAAALSPHPLQVRHIAHLAAPVVRQYTSHPRAHPDILPALLPSDPATWARPSQPAAQQPAAAAAAVQAQQPGA